MEDNAARRIEFQLLEHTDQFTQYVLRKYVGACLSFIYAQPDDSVTGSECRGR